MSPSVGDVVARLREVVDALDKAAYTAGTLAHQQAERAHTHLTEAGRGTHDPDIQRALTDSRTAADKISKIARLYAQAAANLTAYTNQIAPGALPTASPPAATPTGDQLVAEAEDRAPRPNRLVTRLARAKYGDDGLQNLGKVINNLGSAAGAGRATQETSTGVSRRPEATPDQRSAGAGDALLVAAILALVGAKGAAGLSRLMKRRRKK